MLRNKTGLLKVVLEAREEKLGRLELVRHDEVTWVDIVKPTNEDIGILAKHYPFHRLNLEDCLSKIQLTKIEDHADYLFLILHYPTFSNQAGVVLSSQLSIFLGNNYLVTIHQGDLKPLVEMFQACNNGEHQRQSLMSKGSSYLLYHIIDALVDDLFPILDRTMHNLADIEDNVYDQRVDTVREVTLLRRQIADLRRAISPLMRVKKELAMKAQRFARSELAPYFSDVNDHIEKVWESLEECKETIEIYKDTEHMLNTEKSNKILSALTILFTLSIPATVLGTFYGMNINLPGGVETGAWAFFGRYTTLLLVISGSAIPTLIMIWLFRRYGWV